MQLHGQIQALNQQIRQLQTQLVTAKDAAARDVRDRSDAIRTQREEMHNQILERTSFQGSRILVPPTSIPQCRNARSLSPKARRNMRAM